ATLPRRPYQHGANRFLESLVGVAGHQKAVPKPPSDQLPQKRRPKRSVLAQTDIEAQDLSLTLVVHGRCQDERHAHHPTAFPYLHVLGVEPHIRVTSFKRPVAKRLDM